MNRFTPSEVHTGLGEVMFTPPRPDVLPINERNDMFKRITSALLALCMAGLGVIALSAPASATQPAPTACEAEWVKVTHHQHDEWRFQNRTALHGSKEVKSVKGWQFIAGGSTTVNGVKIGGHWTQGNSGTYYDIPDVVINAVWGPSGVPEQYLGDGNVSLSQYGGPNTTVAYHAVKVITDDGFTAWGPFSDWTTTNPGATTSVLNVEHRTVTDADTTESKWLAPGVPGGEGWTLSGQTRGDCTVHTTVVIPPVVGPTCDSPATLPAKPADTDQVTWAFDGTVLTATAKPGFTIDGVKSFQYAPLAPQLVPGNGLCRTGPPVCEGSTNYPTSTNVNTQGWSGKPTGTQVYVDGGIHLNGAAGTGSAWIVKTLPAGTHLSDLAGLGINGTNAGVAGLIFEGGDLTAQLHWDSNGRFWTTQSGIFDTQRAGYYQSWAISGGGADQPGTWTGISNPLIGSIKIYVNSGDDVTVSSVDYSCGNQPFDYETIPVAVNFNVTPNAPTCQADGTLPTLPTQEHITFAWDRPFDGPGDYTLTATAAAGYTISGSASAVIHVLAKLDPNANPDCRPRQPKDTYRNVSECSAPGVATTTFFKTTFAWDTETRSYVGTEVQVKQVNSPSISCIIKITPQPPVWTDACGLDNAYWTLPAETVGYHYVTSSFHGTQVAVLVVEPGYFAPLNTQFIYKAQDSGDLCPVNHVKVKVKAETCTVGDQGVGHFGGTFLAWGSAEGIDSIYVTDADGNEVSNYSHPGPGDYILTITFNPDYTLGDGLAEDGWVLGEGGQASLHVTIDAAEDCSVLIPAPHYTEWEDGTYACNDATVEQTRYRTDWTWTWDNGDKPTDEATAESLDSVDSTLARGHHWRTGSWVLNEDSTQETQTRDLTEDEATICVTPVIHKYDVCGSDNDGWVFGDDENVGLTYRQDDALITFQSLDGYTIVAGEGYTLNEDGTATFDISTWTWDDTACPVAYTPPAPPAPVHPALAQTGANGDGYIGLAGALLVMLGGALTLVRRRMVR